MKNLALLSATAIAATCGLVFGTMQAASALKESVYMVFGLK